MPRVKRSVSALRNFLVAAVSTGALLVGGPAAVDNFQPVAMDGISLLRETSFAATTADEGLTVVGNGTHLVTRGHGSISPTLRRLGWVHIGDPDAASGFVVDAYQGTAQATSKAFTVTYADGRQVLLLHALVPGESYHNSFAAVSPNERWLVAGEWGTMTRLLYFALPAAANSASRQRLTLAGSVSLGRPVRDVQGCDFESPTRLLCSTNDATTSLFPAARQLLSLRLSHPIDGTPVAAAVHLVGSVPAQDVCAGPSGEVEGIDVSEGTVRVAVNVPCASVTEIFTYPRNARWRPAGDIDARTIWDGAPPLIDALVQRRPRSRLRVGT